MATYEAPILENNKKLEEQIKLLQKQIKPIENPIVKKILPFLPYEVNKIILDKLEIMKQIYIFKSTVKKSLQEFLNDRLTYYIDPCYKKMRMNKIKTYVNELDFIIRKRHYVKNFNSTYGLGDIVDYIFTDNNLRKLKFEEKNMDYKDCDNVCEEMIRVIEKLRHILFNMGTNLMFGCLNNRTQNKEIQVLDSDLNEATFKIFKSNEGINNKPYNEFLQVVRTYVLREKAEINKQIINKIIL